MSNTKKQSTLELRGIEKRREEIIRSDYNKNGIHPSASVCKTH